MIIGFVNRTQTVSEGDSFHLVIDVATQRPSERTHTIIFRVQVADEQQPGIAAVRPLEGAGETIDFDAHFGSFNNNRLQQTDDLNPGESSIPSLITQIVNDFEPEEEECFSIQITTSDNPGDRDLFFCHPDPATEFFCVHTICIEDNDGKKV